MGPLASDIAATAWTLLTQAASTGFDTLLGSFAPDFTTPAGVLAYAVAAIAGIAWLTAAPAQREGRRTVGRTSGEDLQAIA